MNISTILKICSVALPALNAAILSSGHTSDNTDTLLSELEVLFDKDEGIRTYHRPKTSFLKKKDVDSDDESDFDEAHTDSSSSEGEDEAVLSYDSSDSDSEYSGSESEYSGSDSEYDEPDGSRYIVGSDSDDDSDYETDEN